MPLIKLTIDNIEVEVTPGTTILNAARKIGGNLVPPAMCYYSKLEGSGGYCRTCLVKVARSSSTDNRPFPKLVPSCRTLVQDGMVVQNISSPEVMENRQAITEFLLLNHPLDCPVCDQAGECSLQDLSYQHGHEDTRTIEERRTFKPVDLGNFIKLNMQRCILCYRCVMVADQLTDKRVHGVLGRGGTSEIGTYILKAIDNDFSGNIIDVCPVGALTDNTFRFKSRVWFTKPLDAHRKCKKCNGKVVLWMKREIILRITGRKDKYGELEAFICNDCRFHHKELNDWTVEGPRRIDRHSVISQNHYEKLTNQDINEDNS